MSNVGHRIGMLEQELAHLNSGIDDLEFDEDLEPQLGEWRFQEQELARAYVIETRPLRRATAPRKDKDQALFEQGEIVKTYRELRKQELEARSEQAPLGEEVRDQLRKLDGLEQREKEIKVQLMRLHGTEAAEENLAEDIQAFQECTRKEPELAQLLRHYHRRGVLAAPHPGELPEAVLVARLTYELLCSTEKGREISEVIESCYRYMTYLKQEHVALPPETRLFIRGDPVPAAPSTLASQPATPYGSSASSSSPSPADTAPTAGSTIAARRPPRLRPLNKKDRLSALQHGYNSLGLSPRKQAIYSSAAQRRW
ncbi:hypothetical protein JCM8547_001109 [Rhodosporidiobolus lusitaniae]